MDEEKIKKYSASGWSFLSHLPVPHECIILTTVPADRANSTSIETAEAIAKELGVSFVPGAHDGLRTFDGSHLNQSSAETLVKGLFSSGWSANSELHKKNFESARVDEPMKTQDIELHSRTQTEFEFYVRCSFIRKFENQLLELFSKGRIAGTTHTAIGQEANAVGIAAACSGYGCFCQQSSLPRPFARAHW